MNCKLRLQISGYQLSADTPLQALPQPRTSQEQNGGWHRNCTTLSSSTWSLNGRRTATRTLSDVFVWRFVADTSHMSLVSLTESHLQIMTGSHPFVEIPSELLATFHVLNRRRPARPESSRAYGHGIPGGLWELIEQCWSHLPGDRPRMEEISAPLASLRTDDRPAQASPSTIVGLPKSLDVSDNCADYSLALTLHLLTCPSFVPVVIPRRSLKRKRSEAFL